MAGRKGEKFWADAVRRAVNRRTQNADGKNTKRLEVLADKLVDAGLDGDISALREIGDRLDGKPAQINIQQGDEEAPLVHEVRHVIVDPPKREG